VFADFNKGSTVGGGVNVLMLGDVVVSGVVVFFTAGSEGAKNEDTKGGANQG
jgi:hypothetical protein